MRTRKTLVQIRALASYFFFFSFSLFVCSYVIFFLQSFFSLSFISSRVFFFRLGVSPIVLVHGDVSRAKVAVPTCELDVSRLGSLATDHMPWLPGSTWGVYVIFLLEHIGEWYFTNILTISTITLPDDATTERLSFSRSSLHVRSCRLHR